MSRFVTALLALMIALLTLSAVLAQQTTTPQVSDPPPIAALITISPPDGDGVVTISGAAGAVFASAQVAIRNLYTEETVYVQAGITGSFTASLFGPGNTPFWISPAVNIPNTQRNQPGSLPGGPGTILYGSFAEAPAPVGAVTRLLTDGDLSDWQNYSGVLLLGQGARRVLGLVNLESLHIGLTDVDLPTDYATVTLTFTLDGALYALTFDPRLAGLAALRRIQPNERDLGNIPVEAVQTDAIEVRIPLGQVTPGNPVIETATLEQIRFQAADGSELRAIIVQQNLPLVSETDGLFRPDGPIEGDFTRFTTAGSVGQGGGRWMAEGRINAVSFSPGDRLALELDVTLNAPELPEDVVGVHMLGRLGLLPLMNAAGQQGAGGLNANNGWSNILTPGGLAINNLRGDFILAEARTPAAQIIRRGEQLVFALDFDVTLPENLPPGLYVPYVQGLGQVADGDPFAWEANNLFASGPGLSRLPMTRLPLVLSVGGVTGGRLVWTLFQDSPSDGSRGLLSNSDQGVYALSNRVRFDSPTYILPRQLEGEAITYPIEPYLLIQLPNAADTSAAPMIPFLFPGGRLTARITRPDGVVEDLGSAAFAQGQLSTAAPDERAAFGAQSPLDIYRLTTLNPAFTDYAFDQYGDYQIELSGSLEDIWGHRYIGGGIYTVVIAEPMDMLPGVLPGTPFEVGDAFNPGLRLLPGAPADVSISARIYPLDGSPVIVHTIQGKANRYGYFHAGAQGFRFETPGEYVLDYEARYTDAEGKLWAASLRGAGVIANPEGSLIARGLRGLDGQAASVRPAWFNVGQYTGDSTTGRLAFPYHSGDVVWVNPEGQIAPVVQAQDTGGLYAAWLTASVPGYITRGGLTLPRGAVEGELPVEFFTVQGTLYGPALVPDEVINRGYTYISAVRPDAAVRQFVEGAGSGGLEDYWNWNDPLNGQIGAGVAGSRAGDYVFLFGGAVVYNEQADVFDTAIYAATALSISVPTDPLGPRIYPPYRGEAGGPNGGPLLVLRDQEISLFFHPTGVRPGEALTVGDTLAVAGQLAPALPSIVAVTLTTPSGEVRQFEGVANAIGYFYAPDQDFAVDEPGVWTVEIRARHEGLTSAGPIEPPPPVGGVLGATAGRFQVYVLPAETEALEWSDRRIDLPIPAAVPYNFTFQLPAGWTNVQVYHTAATASYLLEEGPLRLGGSAFNYQFNVANLGRDFPNLENNGQGSGPAASDVIMLTIVVTGTDGNGRFQVRGRTFTIMHDRMLSLE